MRSYFNAWAKALVFRGRTTRLQFWMYQLIYLLLVILAAVLDTYRADGTITFGPPGQEILNWVIGVHLVPVFALCARRWHDMGASGWLTLLNLIPFVGQLIMLIIGCLPSTPGPNRYGPDPHTPAGQPYGAGSYTQAPSGYPSNIYAPVPPNHAYGQQPQNQSYAPPVVHPDHRPMSSQGGYSGHNSPAGRPSRVEPSLIPSTPLSPQASPPTAPAHSDPLLDKLERLGTLKANGVIDEAEFQQMKSELINRAGQ